MSAASRIRRRGDGLGAGSGAADRTSARDAGNEREGRAFIAALNQVASTALLARMAIDKRRDAGERDPPKWLRDAYTESKLALMALVAMACNAAGGQLRVRVPASVWGRASGAGEMSSGCVTVIPDADFAARLVEAGGGNIAGNKSGDLGFVFLVALVPFIPLLKVGAIAFAVVLVAGAAATMASKLGPEAFAYAAKEQVVARARAAILAKELSGEMSHADAAAALANVASSEAAQAAARERSQHSAGWLDQLFGAGSGRIIIWSVVGLGVATALYYFGPALLAKYASRRALPVSSRNT